MKKKIRLNIGSGSRPINGYLNIDFDSITRLRKRYPNRKFKKNLRPKKLYRSGHFIVFSGELIHGAGFNYSKYTTRIF